MLAHDYNDAMLKILDPKSGVWQEKKIYRMWDYSEKKR